MDVVKTKTLEWQTVSNPILHTDTYMQMRSWSPSINLKLVEYLSFLLYSSEWETQKQNQAQTFKRITRRWEEKKKTLLFVWRFALDVAYLPNDFATRNRISFKQTLTERLAIESRKWQNKSNTTEKILLWMDESFNFLLSHSVSNCSIGGNGHTHTHVRSKVVQLNIEREQEHTRARER